MPDILIRMEMPKTCADCHDADLPTAIAWLGAKCPWANGIIDPGVYGLRHNRHPDCPLHELPPHGNLIDRDKLLHPDGNPCRGPMAVTACKIIEQPTVIPANEGTPTISHRKVADVGVWVEYYGDYRCSACGAIVNDEIVYMLDPNQLPRFCPLCGAKMEVSQESD